MTDCVVSANSCLLQSLGYDRMEFGIVEHKTE